MGTGYKISFKNNNCGVINPLCLKLFDGWGARYSRTHGFGVELNSALFLKKAVPLDNSNFVKVHWGNINTRFIISDFVAQDKKVKKTINIEALGLYHNDISDKNALIEKNMTQSGIIYDYGGLRTLYPKMTNNKVIRHFYYKIMSQSSKTARTEKIREIEKRLEKKDFKDKEKILWAISLSKKHSSLLYKPFIIFKEIMKAFFSCY